MSTTLAVTTNHQAVRMTASAWKDKPNERPSQCRTDSCNRRAQHSAYAARNSQCTFQHSLAKRFEVLQYPSSLVSWIEEQLSDRGRQSNPHSMVSSQEAA